MSVQDTRDRNLMDAIWLLANAVQRAALATDRQVSAHGRRWTTMALESAEEGIRLLKESLNASKDAGSTE